MRNKQSICTKFLAIVVLAAVPFVVFAETFETTTTTTTITNDNVSEPLNGTTSVQSQATPDQDQSTQPTTTKSSPGGQYTPNTVYVPVPEENNAVVIDGGGYYGGGYGGDEYNYNRTTNRDVDRNYDDHHNEHENGHHGGEHHGGGHRR